MSTNSARSGVVLAVCAYFIWGLAPIYFKYLSFVPPLEVLMHRVLWSVVLLAILSSAFNYWIHVRQALRSRRQIMSLFVAGILLGVNWLIFIWAIVNDHMLEASLGYYINPIINIIFGYFFLSERLSKGQWLAVAIVFVGVGQLIVAHGEIPLIALSLAISFSTYGLMRKQLAVDAVPGLFLETAMMLPAALLFWLLFAEQTGNLIENSWSLNLVLGFAGVLTTAPLLCFTAAAKRIRYSTIGFIQYIGPTMMFLLATFVYHEALELERLLTFGCVWTALVIYSVESYRQSRTG